MAFNRRHVMLEGRWQSLADVGVEQGGEPKFRVESIRREQDGERLSPMAADTETVVRGSQPWITILCRFADSTAITPRERSWFDGLMLEENYPTMNHYWQELSDNQINLAGSRVVGWHNLPRPRSYYVYDKDGDGAEDADLPRLTADCAAVADAEIHFPNFFGVNFVFNQNLGCCAWGGATWLSLDGQGKMYGATWIAADSAGQAIFAHEMGHGFGLMHSSGPYGDTNDSAWDVMSAQWWSCFTMGPHPAYGCIGQHTIGWHKELLGWIVPGRLYAAASGSSVTVEIARLSQPSGSGYLLAKIPIAGSSAEFYTVEARQRIGYDGSLPGDAIIIHRVDTRRWDRIAQVVDVDSNGNPNDEGAMWLPGEVFVDNSVKVSVIGATTAGFLVAIENGGASVPLQISTGGQISQKLHYIQSSNSFYGIGSDNAVWKWDNSAKQWSRITGCCVKEDFYFIDESNIYGIGLDGQIWHWNGVQWSRASEGGKIQQKIWYSGGYIYGIGLDNQIWRMIWWFGSATAEWRKITSGPIKIKDDFHFISENDIYGIGLDDGQVWRWNGFAWGQHASGGHIGQKLHFVSQYMLYGIGLDNRIWGWLNGGWSAAHDNGQIKDDFVIVGNAAYGIGLDDQVWQLSSD